MTNDVRQVERAWSEVLADRIKRDGASYVHIEVRDETSGDLDSFNLDIADALDALTSPPAPSGWQQRMEADASPAQDPIDAAVDAQLGPLGDELKAIGHKLAKENPPHGSDCDCRLCHPECYGDDY